MVSALPAPDRERDRIQIRRALISVSDKSGLIELASALSTAGVALVSTGSTCQTIRDAGFAVQEVSEVTGFPESLDGRVKTLHPAIHGGILADLRYDSHVTQLSELGIEPFDLIVVNLYPFAATVASGAPAETVIENVDIGGPAMVRASAKNHNNVAIVVDPADYGQIVESIAVGGTTLEHRRVLAGKAFAHTAGYDSAVATWMQNEFPHDESGFSPALRVAADKLDTLRYGENSHQAAALYGTPGAVGIAQATQLHGKEMSYNNFVDADAALRAAFDHERPAVAIIKHANPCGIAVAEDIATAHARAHACDPVSAFGGVIAANRVITKAAAESIVEIFTEVIVAPGFEPAALEVFTAKKNLRLLQLPEAYAPEGREIRQISGGFLVQHADRHFAPSLEWTLVTGEPAGPETIADLEFAWRACRAVKSNAILLAKDGASVGVGMGQVNRVDSCHLAVSRAGDRAKGSVAASDAFFPFADGLQVLLDAGVTAVVQPGGSVRDEEVIEAAKAAGVTMYFTGERHFFH
ncbi:MAG: bifunctional phosphoribosylaminoimidazolecarboxamide formyltransferase/IMP cyclohydrolase [Actinomycetota bacterium]